MDPAPSAPRPEPVQRWRLTAARAADAPRLTQRDTTAAWESAVLASGLPIVPVSDALPPRPRLQVGAALPAGIAAEAEWLDLLLADRWPRWRVREALEPCTPDGWRLVDLEDVWLGGPALGGLIAGADHRVTLGAAPDAAATRDACRALLEADSIRREREKGGGLVAYDLRPLLLDVSVADAGPPVVLDIRTRIHPSLGSGRPEEVVAALGDLLGAALSIEGTVRVRLLRSEDLEVRGRHD
jgi:radical SAM-linked protein